MTDKSPERVAFVAEDDSVIIADGAKVTGWDTAAKATNRSAISLKGAITDSESETKSNNNTNSSTRYHWYQKPIGIISLGIIVTVTGGVIVFAIQNYFS